MKTAAGGAGELICTIQLGLQTWLWNSEGRKLSTALEFFPEKYVTVNCLRYSVQSVPAGEPRKELWSCPGATLWRPLCAMLHCFGSYILADLLLGEPIIDYFSNSSSILLASGVWYLIFFCPLDLFYKCVCFLPVKLIFVAMKEVVRVRKIAVGIHHAHHHYHHGWFIMIATGPTKASLYGAILFTLQQTRWLPVSKASLIFVFTMFMVSCKVFLTATHSHSSPFDILEGYICPVLFGATWGGDHHHDNHGAPHGMGLGTQHSGLPAKAKEELGEGSRKKKTKKAD